MGGCWSKRNGCVSVGLSSGKVRRRRRRARVLSKSDSGHRGEIQGVHSNPTFQENAAESWFDPTMVIDSEGDDDFYSVQEDILSQRGHETESISSPRFAVTVQHNASSIPSSLDQHKPANAVIISEISTQWVELELEQEQEEEERTREEVEARSLHNNCGLIPSTCLPCLAPIVPFDEKRGSKTPTSPATRKKASTLKFPFKWNQDQHNSPSLVSSPKPPLLQKPIAGSQVPFCPLDKIMSDCWSPIQPTTFKVRGPNYLRDKRKEFAPNYAAFNPFGVDVFLSQRKIDHIARFVELPATSSNSYGKVPPILIVNLQIPLYPATIFQNEYDGEGMSYVFYFKLNENYSQELPFNFQENLRKLIDDEVERVKGFPVDTIASFRERLKILGRVVNMEDLHLSAAERKLMNAYNEKPVLSRPQHEFYLGENYLEIDLDMHRFSFIPRKGLEAFQERLKHCVMDFGLTIQGSKAEDLPEHLLCCLRLKEIDYSKYQRLSMF